MWLFSLAAKHSANRLSHDEIEYLRKNTRYDEKEIKEWYKGFKVRSDNWYFGRKSNTTCVVIKLKLVHTFNVYNISVCRRCPKVFTQFFLRWF